MQLERPDPNFTHSAKARHNFWLALKVAFWFVGILWFIQVANQYLDLELGRFGLRPRDASGMVGIVTAPLLHAGFAHLFSNTMPVLVSVTAMLYLYPNSSVRVLPMIWLGGGLLAWFIGRPSIHVGASGLVYGMLSYIFISGMLRRDFRSMAVSLFVWFLYGSMIWGVLPVRPRMSWEMHLAGAITGTFMAILYRRWDQVPLKRYEWEEDDSVPDWFPEPEADEKKDDERH